MTKSSLVLQLADDADNYLPLPTTENDVKNDGGVTNPMPIEIDEVKESPSRDLRPHPTHAQTSV